MEFDFGVVTPSHLSLVADAWVVVGCPHSLWFACSVLPAATITLNACCLCCCSVAGVAVAGFAGGGR